MSNYNPNTDSGSMTVSTRDVLRPGEWFNELQSLARYPTCEVLMDEGLAKEWPGKKFTWRIADDPGTPKPRTAPYKTFSADNHNSLQQAEIHIRHGEETHSLDESDIDMNSGEAQLVDEQELGMQQMYQRVCDTSELKGWSVPASGTLDEVGIPYYVNWNSSSGGFNGSTPAGYSTVAGIDPAVRTKYRNYTATYTNFTHEDFGQKASDLFRAISFVVPRRAKDMPGGSVDALRVYMGDDSMTDYELMLVAQNDQLGSDGLSMYGKGMLKGITPTAVPQLNSDGTGTPASGSQPIYFINHNLLFPVFVPGWRYKEKNGQVPMSHMKWWGIFWKFNWVCVSRRRQGVMAISAPFGES